MTGASDVRYKVSLVLATIVIVGLGITLFFIYSLPAGLHLANGYEPEFAKVYIAAAATFLLGAICLVNALRYKQEVIVFRDRSLQEQLAKQEADQSKSTISLDTVNAALNNTSGEKEILKAGLLAICKQLDAGQGALYRVTEAEGKRAVELVAGYALAMAESTVVRFEFGEGLVGQAAATGNTLYVDDVPEGYVKIISGLGSASPRFLLIAPFKKKERVAGIVEIASFTSLSDDQRKFVAEAAQLIADKISTHS